MTYARVRAKCASGEEKMFWVRRVGNVTPAFVIVDSRGECEDSPTTISGRDIITTQPAELNESGELQVVI